MTLRKSLFDILERTDRTDPVGRYVDIALIILIIVNVLCVTLETVDWIYARYRTIFTTIEIVSVAVFTLEYALRLWCRVENEPGQPALKQRLQYATSPLAIIDLLAIAPFYLSFFVAMDLRFLRALRMLRIFKLTRYSPALTMLLDVFRQEASSFVAGLFIMMVLLILAASGVYLVEQSAQPDKFGSIPDAMWWAMATLTTVGYGDVTPITPLGKLFGACVTVIGVGMAALPAGILASGLADQLRRRREELSAQYRAALHDGVIDAHEESQLEELRKNLGLSKRLAQDILDDMDKAAKGGAIRYCPHCGRDITDVG